GAISGAANSVGNAVGSLAGKGASFVLGHLPKPHLPKWLGGLGNYILEHAEDYAKNAFSSSQSKLGKFVGGPGLLKGRVTWFQGGATAGGSDTSRPGVALNLHPGTDGGWQNSTTEGWMAQSRAGHPHYARVSIGGKTANLPITDLGPAGWTG